MALEFIQSTGVSDETCFPYVGSNSACLPCLEWEENAVKIEDYVRISSSKEGLKTALQKYGPLVVLVNTPDDWYYGDSGESTGGLANQAVILVGWNNSEGCWIVKNSWGEGWNENGYGKVLYGNLERHNYAYAVTGIINPLVAEVLATPENGVAPLEVLFETKAQSNNTSVLYEWDFGDGDILRSLTLQNPVHIYTEPGVYTATFTVFDNDGRNASDDAVITITANDNSANGMKAYIWDSNAEEGWHDRANKIAALLRAQGFEVIQHIAPSRTLISRTLKDNDIKIYWGLGHGSDTNASTGNGRSHYFASNITRGRNPLTIGIFQHCDEYRCHTSGHWLQESTQGNNNVVAQRFFGEGWCGDGQKLGGQSDREYCECEEHLINIGRNHGLSIAGYNANFLFYYLGIGYTYADAVEKVDWIHAEGRKQGNKDLRYPKFGGDMDYNMVVDRNDVILLRNHLKDPATYPIHSDWDADVNGDGRVNANDANLLANHLDDSSAYPLNPRGWFLQ